MFRTQINEQSPLRILEASCHGGLGNGNLGVVMARAGIGKTAFLVHVALDHLLRDHKVLHVSLDMPVDHVRSWYDAVFQDLVQVTHLEDVASTADMINRNRIIQAYSLHGHGAYAFSVQRLEAQLSLLRQHAGFSPQVILLDAFDWTRTTRQEVRALRELARRGELEVWTTALTHRRETGRHPERVPAPVDRLVDEVSLVIYLEPVDHHVAVRLLKDHDNPEVSDTHLMLHSDTMRLVDGRAPYRPVGDLPPDAYVLLSGGAPGAEEAFGACAERWGLQEENYSFEGHQVARTRGLRLLSEEELREGDVSLAYVAATMHRTYHQNPSIRRVLQSIWHQVQSAGEVFIVGTIERDDTVRGGTGWAAELARHQQKPVHVYDQERRAWFTWNHGARAWQSSRPTIEQRRFAGTGTRMLSDDGRAAIVDLFQRSFGPPPRR
ncbi:MAG: AAA family ATPase [Myxococcales bacterium]|nr:AAA family ATPase [Myxococcota bacterium]MDW8283842.1 AAA family ATPase [Myxococcales bacterium]